MRPDLFTGPAQRDDRHRILARLANGGSVPVPARQWSGWSAAQRARLAAIATLLAVAAASWAWLQDGSPVHGPTPELPPVSALPAAPSQASTPGHAERDAASSQAATIVNAVAPQGEPAVTPQLSTPGLTTTGPSLPTVKPAHPRSAKAPGAPRRQQQAATALPESDEDVTLLAAMLKHAKPQKPSPTPPKD
ncbi:hypothetical protein [Pseudoduganella sp. R-34]|uniref:hypothetical protein n=1 Tax=unclassified Pseudoduganella TaxID=2637179 RepID=UPI003CE6AC12